MSQSGGPTDPLTPRLFGFATLFRARISASGIEPVVSAASVEARALARAIAGHVGLEWPSPLGYEPAGDEWGVSVPFGRCGLNDRPHEHIRLYGAKEAWCDRLSVDGSYTSVPIEEGQDVTFVPGDLQRLRTRSLPGGRVLVAFQTEDRTPLAGNAGAWMGDTDRAVSDDPAERVYQTHQAFDALQGAGSQAIASQISNFLQQMSDRLARDPSVAQEHANAASSGSYEAGSSDTLFDRQKALVTSEVLDGISTMKPERFRFPGMFGAVAPLFDLLK